MPEAFSFGFHNDDIDDQAADVGGLPMNEVHEASMVTAVNPKPHNMQGMLKSLPSKISYSSIQIFDSAGSMVSLPRRELFDIRVQLMAEYPDSLETPIVGLSADDIIPNVFEGGFKTWECSIDLATLLSTTLAKDGNAHQGQIHVIEVGAGTAIPTLMLFHFFLNRSSASWSSVRLTIADYNQEVLELATVPNLLLTWYFARSGSVPPPTGDVEVTQDLLSRFLIDLEAKQIYVSGLSGTWNQSFSNLILPRLDAPGDHELQTIFLASETIYSPSAIRPFTEVLMGALNGADDCGGRAKALVAAKRIYFGIGGGVDEFLEVLAELGGVAKQVWENDDGGVGRVILEITGRHR